MSRLTVLTGIGLLYLAIAGLLFGAAGGAALPMFWAYLAVLALVIAMTLVAVYPRIPEMLAEQARSGAANHDKVTGPTLLALFLSHWIVAGVDVGRYHWPGRMPAALQVVGLSVAGGGLALLMWSIVVNQFYSSRVDIQAERGQAVITTGPYHFVRHPGYSGWILFMVCSGLALGSWLSMVPMLLLATFIVRRTVIEDQMLRRDLPGYLDYARQVRYRLIPGLW